MNKPRSSMEKKVSQLPNWLWSNSNLLPTVYRRIWDAVREDRPSANQGEPLVDTKKVFPLLLTSQLPTEVLGYIWGLANQKYAGKLTEQELYVVLALVAVAQTSYPFTNLEVLHLLPGPPTPRLNLALIYPNPPQTPLAQESVGNFQDFPKTQLSSRSQRKVSSSESSVPNFLQTLSPQESAVNFQDFPKTQLPSRSQRKLSPSESTPPTLPGLIPNHSHMGETKIDSKTPANLSKVTAGSSSEAKLLASLKLDSKASSLSADSGDDFSDFQSAPIAQTQPSIPIWDTKQGSAIGSRLANHNLGVKKTSEKPKKIASAGKNHGTPQIKAPPATASSAMVAASGNRELIACTERLGELFPKCSLKTQGKMVILKDTVIRNNETPKTTIEKIEQPRHKNSNSTTTWKDGENSPQDLMNLQQVEDKYSALRVLVEGPNVEAVTEANFEGDTTILNQSDDFGDFVSAEQPGNFGASSTAASASSGINAENSDDIFTDFERFRPQSSSKKGAESLLNFDAASDALGILEISASPDEQSLDEKYDGIVETEKVVQKEDAISVNSMELGNGTLGVMTRSNSVPSLDLKNFLSPGVEDEQQQVENMHQLIYWEWKRYMESCVLLLQTAANVFGSITSDTVLHEVLASAQGYNFLCNLAEVAAVCRRVNFSHKEMDINIMGFDDLLMDIDRIWAEMEPFYTTIPIVTELPVWPLHHNESTTCCALCLTVVTSGRIVFNDNSYHVTCANLWLNCVSGNLPALRYPASSFILQQHSVPIASISQI